MKTVNPWDNQPAPRQESPGAFFVTGGTLRHDAGCYVERPADREILQALTQGEFCYVLTSRQMGKSSLMARACNRLRQAGHGVLALDLTAIGLNVTPEQWYDGFLERIGAQFGLEDELDAFWENNARLSPVQRFFSALRSVVLPSRANPLAVFVDEIDTVRSLPFSTDEFFAAIRECYNRRAEDPEFNRLTFCLLGVATPSELMRDARMTPFNIGARIELTDFSRAEAGPLAAGLRAAEPLASSLLDRIFFWTNGHPYLTQRLCRACCEWLHRASEAMSPGLPGEVVDPLCETLFLSPRAREKDDNLLFVRERILRAEGDVGRLLELYEKTLAGGCFEDDETDELMNQLRLAGITRAAEGKLIARNRIYERVFDADWVRGALKKLAGERGAGRGTMGGRATEVFQLCLKGRHHLSRRTEEGCHKGMEFFEQAISAAPEDAIARAGYADAYLALHCHYYAPPQPALDKAREAVKVAAALDPGKPETRTSQAALALYADWDLLGAEKALQAVVESDPEYGLAHEHLAMSLAALERWDAAIEQAGQAVDLDPLAIGPNMTLGLVLSMAGETELLMEHGWKMLQFETNFFGTHWLLGCSFLASGMGEEAIAQFRKAVAVGGGALALAGLAAAHAWAGEWDEASRAAGRLREFEERKWVSPVIWARVHAVMSNKELAEASLRQALQERHAPLVFSLGGRSGGAESLTPARVNLLGLGQISRS